VISDHAYNYSYSITMHPKRKGEYCGAKKSPNRGSVFLKNYTIPQDEDPLGRNRGGIISRSQDIKKQTRSFR
jgi:hypothetical protein